MVHGFVSATLSLVSTMIHIIPCKDIDRHMRTYVQNMYNTLICESIFNMLTKVYIQNACEVRTYTHHSVLEVS